MFTIQITAFCIESYNSNDTKCQGLNIYFQANLPSVLLAEADFGRYIQSIPKKANKLFLIQVTWTLNYF